MEIVVNRTTRTKISTIGELIIDGKFECFTLEDKDRELKSEMTAEEIAKIKVFAQTAIPTGRYQLVITFSNRFKQYLPLIVGVPGFTGIRIHSGNTAENSEGCILVGDGKLTDFITNSRNAMKKLMSKLKKAEQKEKIFITIK